MPPWLNSLVLQAPKYVWKTIERVIIAAFTTKATVPLILGTLFWKLLDKLTSADLKELLKSTIESNWLVLLGWFLFAASLVAGTIAFRWREQIYDRELKRITTVKDEAIRGQLDLKLNGPPS